MQTASTRFIYNTSIRILQQMEQTMNSRLATGVVSLHEELPLRLLVAERDALGRIVYRVETRQLRLPVRRDDRALLQRRLLESEASRS